MDMLSLSESSARLSDKACRVEIQMVTTVLYKGKITDVGSDALRLRLDAGTDITLAIRHIISIRGLD